MKKLNEMSIINACEVIKHIQMEHMHSYENYMIKIWLTQCIRQFDIHHVGTCFFSSKIKYYKVILKKNIENSHFHGNICDKKRFRPQ